MSTLKTSDLQFGGTGLQVGFDRRDSMDAKSYVVDRPFNVAGDVRPKGSIIEMDPAYAEEFIKRGLIHEAAGKEVKKAEAKVEVAPSAEKSPANRGGARTKALTAPKRTPKKKAK